MTCHLEFTLKITSQKSKFSRAHLGSSYDLGDPPSVSFNGGALRLRFADAVGSATSMKVFL